MQNTTNYNLKKPEYSDTADNKDYNDNMDAIDTALKNNNDNINLMKYQKSLGTFATQEALDTGLSTEVGNMERYTMIPVRFVTGADYGVFAEGIAYEGFLYKYYTYGRLFVLRNSAGHVIQGFQNQTSWTYRRIVDSAGEVYNTNPGLTVSSTDDMATQIRNLLPNINTNYAYPLRIEFTAESQPFLQATYFAKIFKSSSSAAHLQFYSTSSRYEIYGVISQSAIAFSVCGESAGTLPNNTDLDNVKTAGHYFLAGSYTYLHMPPSAVYTLEVITPSISTTSTKIQFAYPTNSYSFWVRSFANSAWNDWVQYGATRFSIGPGISTAFTVAKNSKLHITFFGAATTIVGDLIVSTNSTGVMHLVKRDATDITVTKDTEVLTIQNNHASYTVSVYIEAFAGSMVPRS